MSAMVDLRGGYGNKAAWIAKSEQPTVGVTAEHAMNKAPSRLWIVRGHRILKPTRTQFISWGGSAAVGTTGAAMLHHEKKRRRPVSKADDDRRGRRAIAGGLAAGGATNLGLDVGGWVTRESIKVNERNIDTGKTPHPASRNQRKKVLSAHRHKHGMTGGTMENAPQSAYRDYPKGMPGWRTRRFMGYKNHPAVGASVLAAGTLTGAAVAGRRRRQPVGKHYTTKAILASMHDAPKALGVKNKQLVLADTNNRKMLRSMHRASLPPRTAVGANVLRAAGQSPYQRRVIPTFDMATARPIDKYRRVRKVDTTMSEREAKHLAGRYDTRGPLPKGLTREQKMKAYEARYVASGGRKAEKWKRRADTAEVGRNVGLAGATTGAALTLAARHKRLGPALRKVKVTAHRADNATIGAAALGGAAELYGEHARSRRASYQNSPGGVAASALRRMQAYTPEKRKP